MSTETIAEIIFLLRYGLGIAVVLFFVHTFTRGLRYNDEYWSDKFDKYEERD